MTEPTYKTVARLLGEGRDRDEIAAALQITRVKVNAHIHDARRRGALPRFEPNHRNQLMHDLKNRGIRLGGLSEVFDALTPEVARWLGEQAVDGSTMAELIAAFVTDAYFEETQP